MAKYRYLFADALTDELLGELPSSAFGFGEGLDADGRFNCTLPLEAENDAGIQLYTMANLAPGNTSIFIEREGVVVWGGLLWIGDVDFEFNTLELNGLGYLSLARRRYIRQTLGYNQVTGPEIAKQLLEYAEIEGQYGFDFSGVIPSGIGRVQTYYGYERKEIAQAIIDMSNRRGGFDFRFTAAKMEDGVIRKRFTTFYPSTGRTTNIHFAVGSNVLRLRVTVDATVMAQRADMLGGGEAEATIIGTYSEPTTYPLYEDMLRLGDEHSKQNLTDHAARRVARGRMPLKAARVTCKGDDPQIGSFIPGDIVRLTANKGWCEVNEAMRIMEYNAEVDANGDERTNIAMVGLNAFDEFGQ